MGAPRVNIKEIDLSTRVPAFPGVFGGIVIAANKGPVEEPFLVTSDSQLLSKFTPAGKPEIGDDGAFFSALAFLSKSNSLWVVRPDNGSLYGGASVRISTSPYAGGGLTTGLSDPTAYVFDSGDDQVAVQEVLTLQAVANPAGFLTGKGFTMYDEVGSVGVWFDSDLSGAPVPGWASALDRNIKVDLVSGDLANDVATKTAAALDADSKFDAPAPAGSLVTVTVTNAAAIPDAYDVDSTFIITITTQGVNQDAIVDECFLLYGANPGEWNNDLRYTIHTYANYPEVVKEPGAFLLRIFHKDNLNVALEEFTLSRKQDHIDGYGNNIYIEEALEASENLRALDNVAILDDVLPQDIIVPVALGGGDNGSTVTDGMAQLAADKLSNPSDLFVTVIMDGGRATPAYQNHIKAICESRKDCVAIFSTPFSDEASSNYINDILEYRKTELNANTSFAALYTPHAKIYDKYNGRNLFVSPDGYVGAAISESAANYEIWYPPAGFKRGIMNVLDLRRRFTQGEMDVLYDNGINPLRFTPGKGILIWGQKTLLSRPSALDRLNVRLLLIVIEPAIAEALEDFIFDLNDDAVRSIVSSLIVSYMSNIQSRRGVFDFQVVCDSSNNSDVDIDNNRLNVDLYIKPTRSIEFINFTVVITATGVDFSDAAAAV